MSKYIFNLGQFFYKVSGEIPGNKAIIFEKDSSSISFRELNILSNKIACLFINKGIKSNDVIVIFNNKSVYGYASMLAALKIGAIYVNLDFLNPVERLEKIISQSAPRLVIVDQGVNIIDCFIANASVVDFNSQETIDDILSQHSGNLEITDNIISSSPAYLMYTSGSTGFPKGAVMTHQNILNFISWGRERFEIRSEDIFTNVNPIYFDNSVFDFYCSIFNGASLLAFSNETMKTPALVVSSVNRYNATIWFSVPSMLIYLLTTKSLNSKDFPSVRKIIFGGEGFPKPNLKKLFDLFNDRIKLVNVYGPTECTCICSAYDISLKDFDDMFSLAPLGKLAPNFGYIISDKNENGTGELLLSGPQVGLGYYNDQERTAASFILNPEKSNYRDFVYKTGDLVNEDKNGLIHFRGRKDNQVKYMGYRIELEEIESAINTIPTVEESAVLYKKGGDFGGQIYGFITTSDSLTPEMIISQLRKKVPSYMIPKSVSILDNMPKNKNGKTDKIFLMGLI